MSDRTARFWTVILYAAFLYALYYRGGPNPLGGLVRSMLSDPPNEGSGSEAKKVPVDASA